MFVLILNPKIYKPKYQKIKMKDRTYRILTAGSLLAAGLVSIFYSSYQDREWQSTFQEQTRHIHIKN